MKKISLILFLLLSTIGLYATPLAKDADSEHIFVEVERSAQFPGGNGELLKWLTANMKYPESALENHIEGKVIVKFTIEKDGTVTNPYIVRGVNDELDGEALRLVNMMPKWNPAQTMEYL